MRIFLYIVGFCFVFSMFFSCTETKNLSTINGSIEIEKRKVDEKQSELYKNLSNIRVSFFKNNAKNEIFGLQVVNINGVHFLGDMNGVFERFLYENETYKLMFYGPGLYKQTRKLKIEKGYEYYIKVYMEIRPDIIKD